MAKASGGLTGENIRNAFYKRKDWVPAGLEGVCLPSTWTPEDHRGLTTVEINRGTYEGGKVTIERIATTTLERRPEWVGQ